MTAAPDLAIAAFLADGGYANLEERMEDSDYTRIDDDWFMVTDYQVIAGVDPIGAIEEAMEACGWDWPIGSDS